MQRLNYWRKERQKYTKDNLKNKNMKYNNEIRKNLCDATLATYIERRIDSLENCLAFATYEIYENALLSASSRLLIMGANVVARRNNLSNLCGKFEEVLNYSK